MIEQNPLDFSFLMGGVYNKFNSKLIQPIRGIFHRNHSSTSCTIYHDSWILPPCNRIHNVHRSGHVYDFLPVTQMASIRNVTPAPLILLSLSIQF